MLAQNESVAAVARKSGFEDYNYFSKVFKRETGLSPSQYKKSCAAACRGMRRRSSRGAELVSVWGQ